MYNIRRPSDIPFLQRKILSKDFNEAVFSKTAAGIQGYTSK